MDILNEVESKMEKAVESMERRFTNVRAGRANPAMLNGIMVNAYGQMMPIQNVANVNVPEAKQLIIKPYDVSLIKEALFDIKQKVYEIKVVATEEMPEEDIPISEEICCSNNCYSISIFWMEILCSDRTDYYFIYYYFCMECFASKAQDYV